MIGGIIPENRCQAAQERGISAVYTPKDIDMNGIMVDILNLIRKTTTCDRSRWHDPGASPTQRH